VCVHTCHIITCICHIITCTIHMYICLLIVCVYRHVHVHVHVIITRVCMYTSISSSHTWACTYASLTTHMCMYLTTHMCMYISISVATTIVCVEFL